MDSASLPDNSDELKKFILSMSKEISSLKEKNIILEYKVQNLLLRLFGKKSEKWTTSQDNNQGFLFDQIESNALQADEALVSSLVKEYTPVTQVKSHNRAKTAIPEHFPREEVIHDLTPEEKICFCGLTMESFGTEILDKVDITPPEMKVTRHIRLKYACPCKRIHEGALEGSKNCTTSSTVSTESDCRYWFNCLFHNS